MYSIQPVLLLKANFSFSFIFFSQLVSNMDPQDEALYVSPESSHYEPSVYSVDGDKHSIHTKQQGDANHSSMFTIKRKIKGKKKTQKINLFNTQIRINAPIVNAVSGYPFTDEHMQSYRVGSNDEIMFFKARYVAGESGIPGLTLFFDTPEQYERHMGVTLSENTKHTYYEKRRAYEQKMRKYQRQ